MSFLINAEEKSECAKISESDVTVHETNHCRANTDCVNSENKFLDNTLQKSLHICEICSKLFNSNSTYQKHRRNYPTPHKYYKCCKKIEKVNIVHKCKKPSNAKKNKSVKSETSCDVNDKKENTSKNEEMETDFDDNGDSNEENYLINSKRKSHFKKEKNEELRINVFKCQECLVLFDKHSNLLQHMKVIHKRLGKYKCQICDEDFPTENEFELHFTKHDPEDKVMCKGCRKIFDSLKLYYIHAKQNPGIHCFICKLCLRQFPTELMLEQHVCICQNGKPLHCACGKEFTKYDDVIEHSRGTKPFYCCSCPHLSISLTAFIRHLRKHSKQKPYQCTKCDMKFAVIDFLNIHNKKCHNESASEPLKEQNVEISKQHVCNICNTICLSPEDLLKHGLQHERIQCPDCGKLLKRSRMENHRNTHKTSASLCPECGKLFDTRFKLTQHIITTHNNEPVKCEVCMKVLKTKKILNEHMKTHLKSEVGGRIPQAICPMCGLGLAQKGSLARHILLTHEKHKIVPCDKTYTCQECSAVLPNRAKYYSHRRMHRAMVDRFPCEVCGREFNKKQNLRRHMYLLHDEKRVLADPIFKCQICTRCFREKKNLKRHYKMVHKLEDIV